MMEIQANGLLIQEELLWLDKNLGGQFLLSNDMQAWVAQKMVKAKEEQG